MTYHLSRIPSVCYSFIPTWKWQQLSSSSYKSKKIINVIFTITFVSWQYYITYCVTIKSVQIVFITHILIIVASQHNRNLNVRWLVYFNLSNYTNHIFFLDHISFGETFYSLLNNWFFFEEVINQWYPENRKQLLVLLATLGPNPSNYLCSSILLMNTLIQTKWISYFIRMTYLDLFYMCFWL